MTFQFISFLLLFESLVSCQKNAVESASPLAKIIYESDDVGQTWVDISASIPDSLNASCVYTEGNQILLGDLHGIHRAKLGSGALEWKKESLFDKNVSDFFPGKQGIYARVYPDGIFQEIRGTGIWKNVFPELTALVPYCILETSEGSILAGCSKGIFKSSDAGTSWKQVYENDGITSIIAADGLLMAGSFQGILRSKDGGEHWDIVLHEEKSKHDVCYLGGKFLSLANVGASWREVMTNPEAYTGKLRISEDGGNSWKRIDSGLFQLKFIFTEQEKNSPMYVIRDVKRCGEHLFCSVSNGIYRSNDWGKSWKLVLPVEGNKVYMLVVSGKQLFAVQVFNGC